MTRQEFARAIEEVREALAISEVQDVLGTLLQEPEAAQQEDFKRRLLGALKQYAVHASRFRPHAQRLADLFTLDELADPAVWLRLLRGADTAYLLRQHERIRVAMGYLPPIARLLDEEPHTDAFGGDPEALLHLTVVEEGTQRSSPQRLATLFESVEKLYEVCAVVVGTRAEQLAVLRADSGQDKTFVLAGTPEVIQALKQLIVSAWDRVVFFRQLAVAERITQVAETLPMLERIGRQERAGQIGPEHAEILRRGVQSGVRQFLGTGVIIPEIEEATGYDPRRLLRAEPKLLVGAVQPPEDTDDEEPETTDEAELPEEEAEPYEVQQAFSAERTYADVMEDEGDESEADEDEEATYRRDLGNRAPWERRRS